MYLHKIGCRFSNRIPMYAYVICIHRCINYAKQFRQKKRFIINFFINYTFIADTLRHNFNIIDRVRLLYANLCFINRIFENNIKRRKKEINQIQEIWRQGNSLVSLLYHHIRMKKDKIIYEPST